MSGTYLRCMEQRSCVASVISGASDKFLHLRFQNLYFTSKDKTPAVHKLERKRYDIFGWWKDYIHWNRTTWVCCTPSLFSGLYKKNNFFIANQLWLVRLNLRYMQTIRHIFWIKLYNLSTLLPTISVTLIMIPSFP